MPRGPVPLVCTTVSPLPSVPPRWAAWHLSSLTSPAPAAALAQERRSGDAQEHKDAPESSSGALCSAQPHTLSPRTASGLHTPRGTWLGLSCIPLRLQPALSKFLCLMQGGETTQMSKGRARGALSCWAGGRLFSEHQGNLQAVLGHGGAAVMPVQAQQGWGRRAGACLVLHGSCCEWLCYLALSLEGRVSK